MKKAFALILSIVMMLSLAVPAFAAETAESRESVVSLTLDPSMESYTLTIPATIEIDITKETTEIPITLEDVTLVWTDLLSFSVSAANWTADAYETDKCSSYLINTEDAAKKIPYLLTRTTCGSQLLDNNSLEVASAYWGSLDFNAEGGELGTQGDQFIELGGTELASGLSLGLGHGNSGSRNVSVHNCNLL